MGQNSSSDQCQAENLPNEVIRQAKYLSEITLLTYEEFQSYIGQLNMLAQQCMDADGKQLVFAVKKGTDSTVFWKGTVRVACVKLDPETKKIETYRLLNLNQFLKVFRSFKNQYVVAQQISNDRCKETEASTSQSNDGDPSKASLPSKKLSASVMLREVVKEQGSDNEKFSECCICLERKPDVILPCIHSYCRPCIEQWNVNHKTCPICRERVESSSDAWVISEAPNSLEISEEICSSLMELVSRQNSEDNEDDDEDDDGLD